jgi:ATP-dependent helicase HrpB
LSVRAWARPVATGSVTVMSSRRPPTDLPVEEVLGPLRDALVVDDAAVLQAPPGAGKTTVVPLDLLDAGLVGPDHRLLVLEPRRVAARAAARRLAGQLGEQVGATVGLSTRDERRVSRSMSIEVVTEGVLLRRLQRDPALAGTGLVLFDEFHERNLEGDLSLAFTLEARAAVRPDLRVLVASATLDGPRIARLLGDAPVVEARGRQHPVEVEHHLRPDLRALPVAVRDAVADVCDRQEGDVLVFLPGAAEIRRVARELSEHPLPGRAAVLPLYGALPPEEQDRALAPDPAGRRKVVLATDLAESSLTIEGVRAVVDAGLAREPRFDAATGMTGLVTVPASRASADQRAGRAGRTGPGLAVRLWPAREHAARDAHPRPAIRTDDLTGTALEVAAWGTDVAELALLDQPTSASWSRALDTLRELGALAADGTITAHGRQVADLPVHPRLGHLVLRGLELGLGGLACEVAAVLGDRDPLVVDRDRPAADLTLRLRVLRGERAPAGVRLRPGARPRFRREAERLARLAGTVLEARANVDHVGMLVALGWPDRVALARGERRGAYLLAGGRGALVDERDPLAAEPWLAVASVDRGEREARVFLAAPVSPAELREVAPERVALRAEVAWVDGDVVAEEREELGALVLARRPLRDPDPAAVMAALLSGLRDEGVGLLRWTRDARDLQARLRLLHHELGAPWPDLSDRALEDRLEAVVGPFLLRSRRRGDLGRIAAIDVLRSQLSPAQLADVDRLAPTHLTVPSGARVRLDYGEGERPVLAVRVQEVFGARRTPTILEGRLPVVLHLLSPARRPVQVTDDLPGFWERAYPAVRSELRGRYPKHAWPEDPTRAAPLRGTNRRRG